MNVALVLAVLLPFFVGEIVFANTSADQPVVRQEERIVALAEFNAGINQRKNELSYRTVRVGLYENRPKIYTDESGAASGIFPAILEEIARKEKWRLIYVPCDWSECLEALESGRIDLMPDVAASSKRKEKFDFHAEEVVSSWSTLYSNKKKTISNIPDLQGRRIAVLNGSIQQKYLKQLVKGLGFDVTFIAADSFEEAYLLTADGNVDAVVSNYFFGDYFYQQYGLQKTPVVFNPVSLYYATATGANPELLRAIDNNLRSMKSEPGAVYYKALARWMEKPPKAVIPKKVIWVIAGISGLLFFSLFFILLLRWQVRVGTRHLTRANELLRNSEKKFHDLFYQHVAVKLLIDPDNGRIVEANDAAGKFYGWSPEQLRRMWIWDILSPEQFKAEINTAKNLDCAQFESCHRLADGSVRDVMMFTSRIDIQGKTLLHSIIHDITEQHRLEEQLQQAQKMESVGRLAGGVAHDYNNMLTVILGYTEMALAKTDEYNPLHSDLKEILSAAKKSSAITRQLLAFARKQVIEPTVLDLDETVEGMLKMLRRLIGEDISLIWLPTTIGLAPVKIDPSQVDQILANLCVNARDAIADVGKIVIKTGNVSFDADYCAEHPGCLVGDFTLLTVTDNGCGMDRETQSHIFEPFFTTKSIGMGTGLGLATVYGIVQQNNGFITVDSEPGKGTTFRVYLPRHEATGDSVSIEQNADKISEGSGETVLLVEDDLAIMSLCRKMLKNLGYQVLTAETPGIALRLAEKYGGRIDLLITDVVMPGMNGHELAEQLLSIYSELKIMFMSGYTTDIITQRGVSGNDMNFIAKPFSQKDLAVKVRKALDRDLNPESG